MYIETERARNDDFRACPILSDYIATMLQDLQHSESDESCMDEREARDTGTIYTLPDETYARCKSDCVSFYAENRADIDAAAELAPGDEGYRYTHDRDMTEERVGSLLWMVRVGHGVGFTDDGDASCLQRLDTAAAVMGNVDAYFGDDGKVYLS